MSNTVATGPPAQDGPLDRLPAGYPAPGSEQRSGRPHHNLRFRRPPPTDYRFGWARANEDCRSWIDDTRDLYPLDTRLYLAGLNGSFGGLF